MFEGFGYSAAEAMLMRVPVVSYAKGICCEKNATIIPPAADPPQIAELMYVLNTSHIVFQSMMSSLSVSDGPI